MRSRAENVFLVAIPERLCYLSVSNRRVGRESHGVLAGGLMKKPRGVSAEMWRKAERLVHDLLLQENISEEDRLNGLILFMRGHGLPCDPERFEKIQKAWRECVDDPPHRRKKT